MNILDFTDYRKAFPLPKKGNKDYLDEVKQFKFIDNLLIESGIEENVISQKLQEDGIKNPSLVKIQQYRRRFRINILMALKGETFRTFAKNSADHNLRLWFTFYSNELDTIFPSKSTLQRISFSSSADHVKEIIHKVVALFSNEEISSKYLGVGKEIVFNTLYGDSTCIEANIHYPVDWLLICDAVKSIVQSIKVIRKNYFTYRIPDPDSFITRINGHCIEMSATYHSKGARGKRKKIVRKMFKLLSQVVSHGITYRKELLSCDIEDDKRALLILKRLDNILDQAPEILRICRRRIISGKAIVNSEKILSLHDSDIHVIVRKKAGKRVEFGNGLYLCEQSQGLILDWRFFKDQPPADSNLLQESLENISVRYGPVESFGGDRGFDSPTSREYLDDASIFNAVARRSVKALCEQLKDKEFVKHQKRRAQTEGRISTVKHTYFKRVFRQRGFENKERSVNWGILAHNLCVLFRIKKEDKISH